jgi:hypothetical protein
LLLYSSYLPLGVPNGLIIQLGISSFSGAINQQSEGKVSQTMCVSKVNIRVNLACFQYVPHRPLLAPIYRWPGLKDREWSGMYYNIGIQHEFVSQFRLYLGLVLTGLRGTQLTGSIIYTLVTIWNENFQEPK